jgi:prepilin-type N-terminal cleavage/methylation domain-containing protein
VIRAQNGFTLVELLIALALAAIVSLLAVSATRFAAMGLERVSMGAQRLETRRNLEALLRRSLEQSLVASSLPNERALDGDSVHVSWLALAEDGGAGLYRDELRLDGQALVLTRRPIGAGAEQRTVLVPRARLRLAYFGTAWQDTWTGMAALPRLVRVALDLEDGLDRPAIVVRLVAAGP